MKEETRMQEIRREIRVSRSVEIKADIVQNIYRLFQKWRTNGALGCSRDYCKREKNVKNILLDLFADFGVFERVT
jgi:hypothetical protein